MNKKTIRELEEKGAIVKIQDGNHGNAHPKSEDYSNSGIPFLMAKDFKSGIDLEGCKFLPKSEANSLRVGFAKPGDVLLTHKGSVGNSAIVPEVKDYVMLSPQVTYYRIDPEKLDRKYLMYAFQHPWFQDTFKSIANQSTRPYIGITDQKNLKIPWHSLGQQRRIGKILSSFDNLIQNNKRRIEILEEIAKTIYREWFVNFNFPGSEDVGMKDSDFGTIPKSFTVAEFQDYFMVQNGYAFKKDNYSDHGIPLIRSKDITSGSFVSRDEDIRIPQQIAEDKEDYFLKDLDFLMVMVGSIGEYGVILEKDLPAIQNQNFWAVRPADNSPLTKIYIMFYMPFLIRKFLNFATGSTRSYFRKGDIEQASVPIPPKDKILAFSERVKPIVNQIENLLKMNKTLRETRDLLLPRLISGEIEV